jgi:phosphatidate cytidylyltransferase
MLRNRLLTALVLIPLIVVGVLLAPNDILALVFGLFVVLGAREMARLGGLRGLFSQWVYALFVGGLLVAVLLLPAPGLQPWLQAVAVLFWVVATLLMLSWRSEPETVARTRPAVLVLGALQLIVAWLSVIGLHRIGPQGPALLLFLMILIWTADSAAYFAGRAWGRRRLSPKISPGKTWEGVAGAMVGAVVCALGLSQLQTTTLSPTALLGLCLLTAFLSIGGDLWESLLKRQAGLKDSGTLLPGHGGVLDRIDSLIAAAPVFALGLRVLGVRA